VVAGVFGEAVLLDPGFLEAECLDGVGEDVIEALAGELGAEGSGGFGLVGFEGVVGIEIAGGEDFLDGAAGDVAAVLAPFLAGAGFALFDFDDLRGGIGVEVAQEQVRFALAAVGFENFKHAVQLYFADGFILLAGVGMKVEDAEGELLVRWSTHLSFQETIGLGAQGGMIDAVNDGEAAKQGERVTLALADDQIHVKAPGDAIEDVGVVGLDQGDHVSALGFDHFGQGIGAAFAAVEDVVAEDSQEEHFSPAPQFEAIIGQSGYRDAGGAISDKHKLRPDVKLTQPRQYVTP